MRYQHRNEIITRFCLSCQAPVQLFLLCCTRCRSQPINKIRSKYWSLTGEASMQLDLHPGQCLSHPREGKAPAFAGALIAIGSLTMSYFHTGIRTIIGAESFHCPVRDGKEWDQLAMVIRHNLLSCCFCGNTTNS